MTKLNQKALASVLGVLAAMAILMFLPATTIQYWQWRLCVGDHSLYS